MSEIINLNKARKKRKREDKLKESSVKRVKFGRTKADNEVVKLETERSARKLDGHKRETNPPSEKD